MYLYNPFAEKMSLGIMYEKGVAIVRSLTAISKVKTETQSSINLYPILLTEKKYFGLRLSSSKYFLKFKIKLSIVLVVG